MPEPRLEAAPAEPASPLEEVIDSLPIGDLLVKVDPADLGRALFAVSRRGNLLRSLGPLAGELFNVARGRSDKAPDGRDARFADNTWTDNPLFRRLAQSYLVLSEAGERLVDRADVNWRDRARARFAVEVLSASLAPTNFISMNPAVIKRAFETGGKSLSRGLQHFRDDVQQNHGLPRSVDRRPFVVGENMAITPGSVVYRDDLFELIQYKPTTTDVRALPLLFVPPEISRHYVMDLAPGRSLAEYAVSRGLSSFAIVWRNPVAEHGHWGMNEYIEGQLRAIDVVCNIAGTDRVNVLGICGGGLSVAAMLGYQAAIGDDRVNSATFMVTMVDSSHPSLLGAITNDRGRSELRERAERNEILHGWELLRSFAWLRPNDLVYNYVVNNWMLGNEPPAFDVLAWNADCTNATVRFVADASDAMYGENRLATPNAYSVLGTPVDLNKVTCPTFHVGGGTDHITPWRPCYMTTQALGGPSEVVVTSTGHVQTIVNPPGKPRARYFAGSGDVADADDWMKTATEHSDSWWPYWADWLIEHSGAERQAPTKLGNRTHRAGEPAPGEYARI